MSTLPKYLVLALLWHSSLSLAKELTKSDFRTIAFFHFINSLNVVRDNRDENMLGEFLNINNEIAHLFEERYQMNAEDLVSKIQKVSGIENHRVD